MLKCQKMGHPMMGYNKMKLKDGTVKCRQCANDSYNRRYQAKKAMEKAKKIHEQVGSYVRIGYASEDIECGMAVEVCFGTGMIRKWRVGP